MYMNNVHLLLRGEVVQHLPALTRESDTPKISGLPRRCAWHGRRPSVGGRVPRLRDSSFRPPPHRHLHSYGTMDASKRSKTHFGEDVEEENEDRARRERMAALRQRGQPEPAPAPGGTEDEMQIDPAPPRGQSMPNPQPGLHTQTLPNFPGFGQSVGGMSMPPPPLPTSRTPSPAKKINRMSLDGLTTSPSPSETSSRRSARTKRLSADSSADESATSSGQQPTQSPRSGVEGVASDFSLLRLFIPDTDSYRDVAELPETKRESLEKWWEFFKTRPQFKQFWKGLQRDSKCCNCKVVNQSDSDWPDNMYRCKTCGRAKKGGYPPCLRLIITFDGTGVEVDRFVEVLPEKGKTDDDGNIDLSAFAYWADQSDKF